LFYEGSRREVVKWEREERKRDRVMKEEGRQVDKGGREAG
jgi:hypothetical protein